MAIEFATEKTIKQPTGGLILEPVTEDDYVLGANDPKSLGFTVILEDGHWAPYLPVQEIQRVRDGDTFACVTFSHNNVFEIIHKRKYNYEINISDMFVAIGAGTVRGKGTGIKTVAEWVRKNGFVFESDYPYSRTMTLDEFYASIPQTILDKGKSLLSNYQINYMAAGSSQSAILEALKFSPVQVAIEGQYTFSGGLIINGDYPYSHAVVIFDYVLDANGNVKEYWIFDSETEQYLRFSGSYTFLSPCIHFFEKKNMKLYKKIGQPAIAVKHWSEDSLIAFSDGKLPGGDLFKSLYGITNYSELPRQDVVEWPYPIKYIITTGEFIQ